ncbi:MAG: Crp/Fnr family transcriptional regulator [Lachnospiraceae bacterium]
MKNYYPVLEKNALFEGIDRETLPEVLKCLHARIKTYKKEEYICLEGDKAGFIGIVLAGQIRIFHDDYNGNRNLTASFDTGAMFGEAFACAKVPVMPVDILSYEDSVILFIEVTQLLARDGDSYGFHRQITENLLKIMARKNMLLNQKLGYICHKTTAEKLLSYLSDQAKLYRSKEFTIPFDRQGLADYLGVERSAMCAELSKLQKNGLLITRKNYFKLLV